MKLNYQLVLKLKNANFCGVKLVLMSDSQTLMAENICGSTLYILHIFLFTWVGLGDDLLTIAKFEANFYSRMLLLMPTMMKSRSFMGLFY